VLWNLFVLTCISHTALYISLGYFTKPLLGHFTPHGRDDTRMFDISQSLPAEAGSLMAYIALTNEFIKASR
jgi:hypothetical protein